MNSFPTFAGPDLVRAYWLLAAMNGVAVIGVVIFDWKTWLPRRSLAPASVEAVPGIS